jgi:hypothetical protein
MTILLEDHVSCNRKLHYTVKSTEPTGSDAERVQYKYKYSMVSGPTIPSTGP